MWQRYLFRYSSHACRFDIYLHYLQECVLCYMYQDLFESKNHTLSMIEDSTHAADRNIADHIQRVECNMDKNLGAFMKSIEIRVTLYKLSNNLMKYSEFALCWNFLF